MAASRVALASALLLLIASPGERRDAGQGLGLPGRPRSPRARAATFTVTVKAGKRQVSKGSLTLLLSTDAKARQARPQARDRTDGQERQGPQEREGQTLTVNAPGGTAARSYRVLACLTVARR